VFASAPPPLVRARRGGARPAGLAGHPGGAPGGALLVFDLGYINFTRFAHLTLAHATFVTRAKSNLSYLAAEAVDLGIVKRKRHRDPTPARFTQLCLTFASTA